mmetsp:Transcript_136875/g.437902  ORF Transcript_136875/g.437902 Transcript_136875/m.437902 type:complete len:345 (-) Transcript_136875:715-1749(-)
MRLRRQHGRKVQPRISLRPLLLQLLLALQPELLGRLRLLPLLRPLQLQLLQLLLLLLVPSILFQSLGLGRIVGHLLLLADLVFERSLDAGMALGVLPPQGRGLLPILLSVVVDDLGCCLDVVLRKLEVLRARAELRRPLQRRELGVPGLGEEHGDAAGGLERHLPAEVDDNRLAGTQRDRLCDTLDLGGGAILRRDEDCDVRVRLANVQNLWLAGLHHHHSRLAEAVGRDVGDRIQGLASLLQALALFAAAALLGALDQCHALLESCDLLLQRIDASIGDKLLDGGRPPCRHHGLRRQAPHVHQAALRRALALAGVQPQLLGLEGGVDAGDAPVEVVQGLVHQL